MRNPKEKKYTRGTSDCSVRTGRIGAAQFGACNGVPGYTTAYDVYCEYKGVPRPGVDEKARRRMDMGRELEDTVARIVSRQYSLRLRKCNRGYIHKEHPWMMLHPDREVVGLVDGKRIGVEIKSANAFSKAWGPEDSDEIPEEYLCQCYGYFIVKDYDEVWLFCFKNNDITRYVIHRDAEIEERIFRSVLDFKERLDSGWIPDKDGYLQKIDDSNYELFTVASSTAVVATESMAAKAIELKESRKEYRRLALRIKVLKKELSEYLGEKGILTYSNGRRILSLQPRTRKYLGQKELVADNPEMKEKYAKKTSYRVMR